MTTDDLNMDDLWSQSIDTDEITRAQADLLLPVGTYTTVAPLTMSFNEEADDKRLNSSGRGPGQIARFYGLVQLKATEKDVLAGKAPEVDAVLAQGMIGFGVSPRRVNAKDQQGKDLGKPDKAYRLWINAVAAYKMASGDMAPSNRAVLDFLRDYAVRLRIGQYNVPTEKNPEPEGEPGNTIYAISAVRD